MTDAGEPASEQPLTAPADANDTVGTGSVFAIGCTLLTVAAIAIGVIVFVLIRLL